MQWRFGRFHLDEEQACLWDGDRRLPLRPKTFALLSYLVRHAGELVRKDTLLEALWPDTAVTEGVLTTSLGELRKVLGETAKQPQYIATESRRGYRFMAPVTLVVSGEASPARRVFPQGIALFPGQSRLDARLPSVLVDREAELTELQQWFQDACRGQRQVAFITGEAGIGKTTLVDAFLARLAAHEPLHLGRGQCLDHYGAGEAYLPLLEALGQMGRAADGPHLTEVLRRHAPSWLLQLPALWSVEELPGLQQRTLGATRERMLRELAEAVEALAHDRPVVVVLEDLHWSDVSTLDWVAYVARRRASARLLVLGTYRPVDAVVREHPIRAVTHELRVHGQCAELLLPYVSEAGVAAYLERRYGAGACAAEVVRALYQCTGGNPLFFVTVVEEMWRQGKLARHDTGREERARDVASILGEIPESLRHVIERQFAQLAQEDQTCLEAASVVGKSFTTEAVAACLGGDAEGVEVRYVALARRGQFVQALGSAAWPDGTVSACYQFTHDLYHDVVYTRIPTGRCARWHRQIGQRLEAGYGAQASSIAVELAEHCVRGQAPDRAVQHLHQAAVTALSRHAHREAVTHLTRMLEALTRLPESPERHQQELQGLVTLGRSLMATLGAAAPEVAQTYARASALCQHLEDATHLLPVLAGLQRFYMVRADYPRAHELGMQLLDMAQRLQDQEFVCEGHTILGVVLSKRGQLAAAHAHQEQAHAVVELPPRHHSGLLQDVQVANLANSAHVLWCLGYAEQALDRSQTGLRRARTLVEPTSLAFALLQAATCTSAGGRPRPSRP